MMKLVILGATGQTGKEVIKQALEAGHSVTAVVRDPKKITTVHDNLKVVEGNIFDQISLTRIFKDNDAVMSCLGFPRNPQPVKGYTESAAVIAPAMREANINRFITMTAWYCDIKSGTRAGFLINWLLIPFLKPVLINMHEMENYIESSCSDLNYTVVRPPGLSNGVKTGKPVKVAEDYLVNTGTSHNQTSRADVAAFMLSCLGTNEYDKKMVAMCTER